MVGAGIVGATADAAEPPGEGPRKPPEPAPGFPDPAKEAGDRNLMGWDIGPNQKLWPIDPNGLPLDTPNWPIGDRHSVGKTTLPRPKPDSWAKAWAQGELGLANQPGEKVAGGHPTPLLDANADYTKS